MCDLCSNDEETLVRARMAHSIMADRLHRLADQYEQMAAGRVKPHTEEIKGVGALATLIIRGLVEEWV